ncbi:MAG: hypothetical protein KKC66_03690 [Candidatus Omnitrophica bacterium]|nr:hypothetical protein [Candidatus Omnitrophota bacterium]MBU1932986.1 hypothetical protein [Candidatus Omnitrophota bacterium]
MVSRFESWPGSQSAEGGLILSERNNATNRSIIAKRRTLSETLKREVDIKKLRRIEKQDFIRSL